MGLIGVGMVGRALCRLLESFNLKFIGHDPYLDPAVAEALGVELVDLPDVFSRAYVVSNHLPNIPSTRGLLGRSLCPVCTWKRRL